MYPEKSNGCVAGGKISGRVCRLNRREQALRESSHGIAAGLGKTGALLPGCEGVGIPLSRVGPLQQLDVCDSPMQDGGSKNGSTNAESGMAGNQLYPGKLTNAAETQEARYPTSTLRDTPGVRVATTSHDHVEVILSRDFTWSLIVPLEVLVRHPLHFCFIRHLLQPHHLRSQSRYSLPIVG